MHAGCEIWDAGHEIWDVGCMQDVRFGLQDSGHEIWAAGCIGAPCSAPLPLFPNAAWDGIPELAAGARRALQ